MEAYINDLKNNETFFVLFNENNFHDYLITDGMLFSFDNFNIILHFFEDFYNFNLNIAQKENEYVISLGEKISKKIGYAFCGFYPKSNCHYTNNETEIKIKDLQKEIINGIIQDQVNYYIPNENNNRVICFHNGNGEFGDSIPLNPITFDTKDISVLKQFCLSNFNFNIDMAFHGNYKTSYTFLKDDMKSYFQKRIISSNYKEDILYSDSKCKELCFNEKKEILNYMYKTLNGSIKS